MQAQMHSTQGELSFNERTNDKETNEDMHNYANNSRSAIRCEK